MKPVFFKTQAAFRAWLEKHHKSETELLAGLYKVGSGKPSITWPQSVDEALCFGWIDGVRKSFDEHSYTIRFTPRKPSSIWSAVNIKKVKALTEQGLMKPEGLAAFAKKQDHRSLIYSYEKEAAALSPEFEKKFKADKKAWAFFTTQAPSYQKLSIHRVMDAKQEKTRISRFENLLKHSAAGKRLN